MKEGIKRGEIYYAELNPVRGSEQGGYRPVLVVQNDTGNTFSPTTIVAAITSSRTKTKLPTHVTVSPNCLEKESIVLLEQIRTVDRCRLSEYIGQLSGADMDKVDRAIEVSFGLDYLEVLRHE